MALRDKGVAFAQLVAIVFILLPVSCIAQCSMNCHGHGTCGKYSKCTCYPGWDGATDCSAKSCPKGTAIFSKATHDTTGFMAECSNAGVCDPLTGFCVCRAGYTGDACQRLTCPPYIEEGEENVDNICNGHGTCESMERAAANYGMDTSDGSIGDGRGPGYTNWDKTTVRGCVCSWGYTGEDCTLKLCQKCCATW